jgi:hypothetical protein
MVRPLRRPFSALLILLTPLAAGLGCARSTTSVVAPQPPATVSFELDPAAIVIGDSPSAPSRTIAPFYPLALGDHWTYDRTLTSRFGYGPDELAESVIRATVTRELNCSIPAGPDLYVSEHTVEQDEAYVFNSWILYRQDSSGLYEADYLFTDSSPCADPGAAAASKRAPDVFDRAWSAKPVEQTPRSSPEMLAEWNRQQRVLRSVIEPLGDRLKSAPSFEAALPEIQRLGYPLHGGSQWITRNEPRFTSRVVAHQRVRTPAGVLDAYKILITSDLFGPRDKVFVWYGKVGFIGIISYAEGYFVDENGIFAGWLKTDYREILTGYRIQEPLSRN